MTKVPKRTQSQIDELNEIFGLTDRNDNAAEAHITTRYHRGYCDDSDYVHKYYLPHELKPLLCPSDIEIIVGCFALNKNFSVGGCIPDKLGACVIHYKDIGLDKSVEEKNVRRVLEAYFAYWDECHADLTLAETQAALKLNAWLIEWEKQLLARFVQISEEMERKIRSGDTWLTDYELKVVTSFYLRDDDPFSDECARNSADLTWTLMSLLFAKQLSLAQYL